MSDVLLRAATADDVNSLIRIQRDQLRSSAECYSFDLLDRWAESLRPDTYTAAIEAGQMVVAVTTRGYIKGFAHFDSEKGEIRSLCVALPFEGEGVGRRIVRECVARARGRALPEVSAIAPLNSIEFYEALHFEVRERRKHFLPGGLSLELAVMSRPVILPAVAEQIAALEESNAFFAAGPDRNYRLERIVVESFLRGLGIEFMVSEITRGDDPPDACFRSARFEIKGLYDDGRRMHQEYKEKLKKSRDAAFHSDLTEMFVPRDATLHDIIRQVMDIAIDKGTKYSSEQRAELDFLVYVNLQHIVGIKDSPWPDLSALEAQGWRSVSFTRGVATSCVLTAGESAPGFLKEALGKFMRR